MSLCITDAYKEFVILESMDKYMVYVSAVLEVLFLVLAIITYVFIFLKFVESRRQPKTKTQKKNMRNQQKQNGGGDVPRRANQGMWKIFCNSSFYVYVILVLNIILFNVLPQLVFFLLYKDEKETVEEKDTTAHSHVYGHVVMFKDILVVLSDIFDVVIYIVLDRSVRKRFLTMLCADHFNQRSQEQRAELKRGGRTATSVESISKSTASSVVYHKRGHGIAMI